MVMRKREEHRSGRATGGNEDITKDTDTDVDTDCICVVKSKKVKQEEE